MHRTVLFIALLSSALSTVLILPSPVLAKRRDFLGEWRNAASDRDCYRLEITDPRSAGFCRVSISGKYPSPFNSFGKARGYYYVSAGKPFNVHNFVRIMVEVDNPMQFRLLEIERRSTSPPSLFVRDYHQRKGRTRRCTYESHTFIRDPYKERLAEKFTSMDWAGTRISQTSGQNNVIAGPQLTYEYDNYADANQVRNIIEEFKFTRCGYVGQLVNRRFLYPLVGSRPVHRRRAGVTEKRFNRAKLKVIGYGTSWRVLAENVEIARFINERDAVFCLRIIKKYQFNYFCAVGADSNRNRFEYFRR